MTELLPLRSTEKDDLEEIKSELGNISEQLQTLLAKLREELRPLRDKGKSFKVTNAFIGYLINNKSTTIFGLYCLQTVFTAL